MKTTLTKNLYLLHFALTCLIGFTNPTLSDGFGMHQTAISLSSKDMNRGYCKGLDSTYKAESGQSFNDKFLLYKTYYNYARHRTILLSSKLFTAPIHPKSIKTMLFGALLVLFSKLNYRRILWPGSLPDPTFKEPLPPGDLGCPFLGTSFNLFSMFSYKKEVKKNTAADFDKPRMKFFYAFLSPMIFVSGRKIIKQILNSEFESKGIEIASFLPNERKLLGGQSILYSNDKNEHNFLRRLIGNAMTPTSISKAIPQLQHIATNHINSMLQSVDLTSVYGENVLHEFTLDVAFKIILGFELPKEDERKVKQHLDTLIDEMLSLQSLVHPIVTRTKGWKARQFLVELIEQKIIDLRENGPDGSTLSAMVFAVDDDSNQSLSHEQIVDNVLFLLLAGSETSSSTLTNCLLFLGLHPHVWKKVIKEQHQLCDLNGELLTKDQLDKQCPYLEAVIKEVMRIRPISGGQYRRTKATIVVDGMQIPKGWPVVYNTRETHRLDPTTRLDDGSHMDIVKGFNPERWLDDSTTPKDGDYMPFGSGPRYCLGATLAMAEMKIFLAIMARKVDYDLVSVDDPAHIEWKRADLIAVPKDGVIMSVKPSNHMNYTS